MFKSPENLFKCKIILKSKDRSDVRIYKMQFPVMPKVIKATIEMQTSCGEELI